MRDLNSQKSLVSNTVFVDAKANHVYWKKEVCCVGTICIKMILLLETLLVRTNRDTRRGIEGIYRLTLYVVPQAITLETYSNKGWKTQEVGLYMYDTCYLRLTKLFDIIIFNEDRGLVVILSR